MHKKIYLPAFFAITLFFFHSQIVLAHSTVSPSQVSTSKYETFTLGVPTERDVPTVDMRLLIPESLDRVTPFVKPGWDIEIKTTGDGEEARVTEITWTGGSIPTGQKDIFEFTARTPQENATLVWKVYQTYENGEVVAWDRDPSKPNAEETDGKVKNPYSMTEVVVDGSTSASTHSPAAISESGAVSDYASLAAFLALFLSIIAIGVSLKSKKA